MPTCSIVLDARLSGARLPRQLGTLHKAVRQGKHQGAVELLVVDDTKDARLSSLTQRYGVRLLSTDAMALGGRLNAAVSSSAGEILIFPGAAIDLSPVWVTDLVSGNRSAEWDAVVLGAHRPSSLPLLWRLLRRPSLVAAFCVTRSWFERIGGFDPALEAEALPELLSRLRACQARVANGEY
ncbi:glycosyltransferase family 2 protein [Halomonas campisalis]|uniref:Glycosyltransferase family 2 protein n=1 Tax=Billgrantia campisalis TaxID=74661 RepID=A0ABS9PBP7_9GAMM|nr:glycosyltransferase family A protein [Halomonas campisalis]MCG6658874.1 glycosyltransferase family 2 protein [Halomonas campisalis]MDR5864477.1 glycosyltransferase family A protein [Halomonas campisalis]